ncbi:hypothetical protein UACE39S_05571 [Ureibacillus acetophenoni]
MIQSQKQTILCKEALILEKGTIQDVAFFSEDVPGRNRIINLC